jgi:hypothetical protein
MHGNQILQKTHEKNHEAFSCKLNNQVGDNPVSEVDFFLVCERFGFASVGFGRQAG